MDKVLFKTIEDKLYRYFSIDKKILGYKNKINLLERQKEFIESRIRNTDVSIPAENGWMYFKEENKSCTEIALSNIIEKLLSEKIDKEKEIARLENLIRTIEEENSILRYRIENMDEEDKSFLRMKYKEKLKDWQIGVKMNVHQTTASRQKKRLIKEISNW